MTKDGFDSFGVNFKLSDQDFEKIAKLAKENFGLNLLKNKKSLISSRISKRLKARKARSIDQYLKMVFSEIDECEKNHFITSLTTNVTSFFREPHHFDSLSKYLSENENHITNRKRLRIWSAGCSSGQEPYSIAMLLNNILERHLNDIKILATDIDQSILEEAKNGLYSREMLSSIPSQYQKHFPYYEKDETKIKASNGISKLISFAQLNLIEDWPFNGPFDAIFCRNVTIYFDAATQQKLWFNFSRALSPGGLLFIGHSERVSGESLNLFNTFGVTSYQKKK